MRRDVSALATAAITLTATLAAAAVPAGFDGDPRWKAARVDGGRVGVVVELAGEPTARTYARTLSEAARVSALAADVTAMADAAARRQLAQVEAAQQAVLPALTAPAIGAEVVYRVQRVYNGIVVYADPQRLDAIAALPGVAAIHPLVPDHLQLTSSVPWIGAPQVWQGIGNATGTGVSIGIIDSGIDYLHLDFGGSGVYTGQNFADNTVPWNAKVVGGYDFAGDSYTGSNTPKPDGDPMDLASVGHGTHVAGIAAGYGVDANGDTYAGPWSPSADVSTFLVGPGVAPGAKLYAIRVFGSGLSTGLTNKGVEWAVDPNGDGNLSDHLDVINLSLGSPFGDVHNSTVTAVENAAAAGVVVVCAAGNEGDTTYIVASPGIAAHALSVAASADGGNRASLLTVDSPSEIAGSRDSTPAAFGGTTPEAGLSNSVVLVTPNDACTAITNAAQVTGKIALIDRGTCTFVSKVKMAQNAGAVAAVVADNKLEDLITMAGTDATVTIPAVFVSQATGTALKGKLPTPGVQATVTVLSYGGAVAPFSSRGPRESQDALKPDITAPGYVIFSAEARGGTTAVGYGGTSMATPHVAGAMALLKQLHPTWTPSALKALAMNTSTDLYFNVNQQPPLMSPARVGAGELYLPNAAAANAIAFDADRPELVSLSFGAFEVTGTTTLTRTVKVENRGASALTFALAYSPRSDVEGVDVGFPGGSQVAVAAGGSATFTVQLQANAAAMDHGTDPGADPTQDDRPRQLLGEEAGYVTLTAPGATTLRVPLYAAPRPAAAMGTLETGLNLGADTGTLTVNLRGRGLASGTTYPRDIVSLVTPLELQYQATSVPDAAAIRYVGVASDYAGAGGGSLAATTIEFGVVTGGDWATPSDGTAEVDIDVNRDGTADYRLQTIDSTTFADSTATPSDVFGVQLCPTGGACSWAGYLNRLAADEYDTVVFGTNVVVLPVSASAIGLSAGNTSFKYKVVTSTTDSGSVSDWLTWDVAKPGLAPLAPWFGPAPEHDGDLLQLAYDRAAYTANASKGLLLLHHHNAAGNRAQAIPITTSECALTCTATASPEVAAGAAATFAVTTVSTCAGTVTFDWNFGDGTTHGSGTSTTHAYANQGSYGWQLTGSAGGQTCTDTGTISVGPAAPGHVIRRRPVQAVK